MHCIVSYTKQDKQLSFGQFQSIFIKTTSIHLDKEEVFLCQSKMSVQTKEIILQKIHFWFQCTLQRTLSAVELSSDIKDYD